MSKKDITFIIGLTILMGIIWMAGERVMPKTHLWWTIGIVAFTLIVSVWHSMKADESDLKDPKREKYLRKTSKRKQ